MRHIIIAAGEAVRWSNYQGTTKHLISPDEDGETLLTRICRQLQERDQYDVVLTGRRNYRQYIPDHVTLKCPPLGDSQRWRGATKFHNTIPYWSATERTVIWFGDAWLEDAVVDRIVNANLHRLWLHWCRMRFSPVTGCTYGEPFGVSFWPEHHDEYEKAMQIAVDAHNVGDTKRSNAWEIARIMGGARGRDIRKANFYHCFREVGDLGEGFSEDFDKPVDLEMWRFQRRRRARLSYASAVALKSKLEKSLHP